MNISPRSLFAVGVVPSLLGLAVLPSDAAILAHYAFADNYSDSAGLPEGVAATGAIAFAAGLAETVSPAGTGISTNPDDTLFVRSTVVHEATAAAAIGAADYFSFDLTIVSGFALNLTGVSVSHWSSNTAYVSNIAIYHTLGATDFSSEAVAVKLGENSTNATTATGITLSDNLAANEALTGTVRFHVVFRDPANNNTSNRVSRLDDIMVIGDVTAVPEPSMMVSAFFVSLCPVLRRRRSGMINP